MEKKANEQPKPTGCPCGCSDVLLTEEANATPRCAACGKPIKK